MPGLFEKKKKEAVGDGGTSTAFYDLFPTTVNIRPCGFLKISGVVISNKAIMGSQVLRSPPVP
jgi:hypothetical protein